MIFTTQWDQHDAATINSNAVDQLEKFLHETGFESISSKVIRTEIQTFYEFLTSETDVTMNIIQFIKVMLRV